MLQFEENQIAFMSIQVLRLLALKTVEWEEQDGEHLEQNWKLIWKKFQYCTFWLIIMTGSQPLALLRMVYIFMSGILRSEQGK